MANQSDITQLSQLPKSQLLPLVNSESPPRRTAAVRLLTAGHMPDDYIVNLLLERLCIEKHLYTRLEICSALENGDIDTAASMTRYLGCIGTNHHKSLPKSVSNKISYPLPRDIIARTLAKMDTSVFPALAEVLLSGVESKISEVIDSIGFMIFYNGELSTLTNFQLIADTMEKFAYNEIIYWKSIICLSAFDLNESIKALDQIILKGGNLLLLQEASRSHSLV